MLTAKDHVTNIFGHKIEFLCKCEHKRNTFDITLKKVLADTDFDFLQKYN